MHICMQVCVCVCIYIYIYLYTHTLHTLYSHVYVLIVVLEGAISFRPFTFIYNIISDVITECEESAQPVN